MSRRRPNPAALIAAVAATAGLCGGCITPSNDEPATPEPTAAPAAITVVRVIDGDSLEVEASGEEIEVRLVGYNAPELYGDDNTVTCNGSAAKAALGELIETAEVVQLVGDEVDRYGRTLADLVVDEASVIETLVADGRGLATGDDGTRRSLMIEAAQARRGLWGPGCGTPTSTDLVIDAVQADAPGNDRNNLNEEWVRLANQGDHPIELDGWVLRDDTTGHRFTLDGSLDPGATLTVRSGPGQRSDTDFHLDESFPVWSNTSETVLLADPAGVVVDWLFLPDS